MEENNKIPNNTVREDIKTVRTLSSDMAEAVRDNEMSVMKVALAEQKKREGAEIIEKSQGTGLTKALWIGGGVLLVALGVGAYYYIVSQKTSGTVTNTVNPQMVQPLVALVPYDQKVDLDVTNAAEGADVINLITQEISNPTQAHGLRAITLNTNTQNLTTPVTAKEFVRRIELTMPTSLVISLADSYMIGTYLPQGIDARPHLFLMFQTKDYNTAYASLLTWENTILDDVFTLFNIHISGENKELLGKPWKDVVINNKDARALYDKQGTPVLYYLFLNKDYFIITDDIDTIREVNTRLITKNIKPL
jgi:hypothetical protein